MHDPVREQEVWRQDPRAVDEEGVGGEGDGDVASVEGFERRGGGVPERGVVGSALAADDVVF